ncbi:hypothetical protein CFP56_015017 [Quercus suber]|uniref:Uncharacterized protein n=1 Tax=Quercus suber TaxID=58331 RepID=A0AAW0KRG7_QUESU
MFVYFHIVIPQVVAPSSITPSLLHVRGRTVEGIFTGVFMANDNSEAPIRLEVWAESLNIDLFKRELNFFRILEISN